MANALVSPDELRTYLKVTAEVVDDALANLVLDGLVAQLESWIKRPVALATFTDEKITPHDDGIIFLRQTPVGAVTAVVHSTQGALDPAVDVEIVGGGIKLLPYVYAGTYDVTYTAGVEARDPDIAAAAKLAVLDIAASSPAIARAVLQSQTGSEVSVPAGISSLSVEGSSVSYDRSSAESAAGSSTAESVRGERPAWAPVALAGWVRPTTR